MFAHVRLHEPAKDAARPTPSSARSRRCSCRPDARPRGDRGRRLGHRGRDPFVDGARRACARRCCSASRSQAIVGVQGASRLAGGAAPARHRRLRQVQIDPWPAGSFGVAARGRPPHQPLHRVPARRRRATTGTRGRSRASSRSSTRARARCSRSSTSASCRCRPSAGSYLPADVGPLRDDLKPLEIVQPDGPSFDGRRATTCAGSAGRSGSASTPTRASCCTRSATTTATALRPVLHRASISRDGRPLRRSRRDARLEERVRRRRVGPRPHGQLAEARLRLPRRHPLLRRGARDRAGRPVHRRARDLHARRGLRDPLEAPRPARRHRRDAPLAPPRRELHRHRRQLRVRLLLVLLPRRQHPARGEAHRHRVAHGDHAGRPARVRQRDRARARGAAPPAPLLGPPRPRRRRHRRTRVYEVEAEPVPAGPDNPWGNAFRQQVDAARHRARARNATSNAATSRAWQVVNPSSRNGLGQPVGYKLVPTMSTPTHARVTRVERRPARRVRAVTTSGSRRTRATNDAPPASTRTSTRAATGCPRWTAADRPVDRHRRRALVHVRRHPLRAARGLAGDAGRVHGVPALAGRLLRPQPGARRRRRRAADGSCHADANGARAPESAS